jgi:hypothetical protein
MIQSLVLSALWQKSLIGAWLGFMLLRPPVVAAKGQTIHWGNAIGDTLLTSDGSILTTEDSFVFELGVFTPGFVPEASNSLLWTSNWHRLDGALFNDPARYFSSSFEVSPQTPNAATLVSNSPEGIGTTTAAGADLYLWVYNNTAMNQTTETYLGRASSWTVPAGDVPETTPPLNLRLSQITSVPVYGGNNNLSGPGENVSAAFYSLQTSTFPSPVPEPTVGLCVGLSMLVGLRRRRLGTRR